MRLERLDLTRYGKFTGAQLAFPAPAPGAPDLHVVYGPNEAGKSTLFAAWLDLLYGIHPRTRHDFLHPGPTMQIGARLATAAGTLDVVRVKRTGPSLLDPHGAPMPEASLQAALAGLSRDGYGSMFSLDDDTLERGGDSILASRGDLGEMLFSASAGLAGLGPQLDAIRKDLEAFHKAGGRKTVVKAARDAVLALDRARRDMDTSASAMQKLQRDAAAAQKAWEAARGAEAAVRRELEAVQAALATLPQRERLARLQAEAAALDGVPDATEADARHLHGLEQALQGLAGQMATRAGTLAQIRGRIAGLARDPAVLPLVDRIAQVAELEPQHVAALADVPRRREALAEAMDVLAQQMAALGLGGAPADHVVAPAAVVRLRALVARRDAVMQARTSAQDELARAEARLASIAARVGDVAPVQDLRSLGHLVARMRAADPEAALA
ncbi:MAG: AAA family ATPase, partial [Gemmobacter sp.]|nr:AAA family ATPase [Gemmobacter sp.]